MYAQNAKEAQVEEVILHRDNIVTGWNWKSILHQRLKVYLL
jgi:hypothetical protein